MIKQPPKLTRIIIIWFSICNRHIYCEAILFANNEYDSLMYCQCNILIRNVCDGINTYTHQTLQNISLAFNGMCNSTHWHNNTMQKLPMETTISTSNAGSTQTQFFSLVILTVRVSTST